MKSLIQNLRAAVMAGLLILGSGAKAQAQNWTAAASLATGRYYQTATLLPNGKVLVAGGININSHLASAELYDPATNTWSAAGSLATGRYYHTATLLLSGKVLVAAGYGDGIHHTSAELYDPATNNWTPAGNLTIGRNAHTASLLPNGKVLVVGGVNGNNYYTSAEVYDPATNAWSPAGSLAAGRYGHLQTALPSGKVLVSGGFGTSGYLASAEVYDPATDAWSGAGTLAAARYYHSSTLLPSGLVMVAGGLNSGGHLAGTEVYDPATNAWSVAGSLSTARYIHTATLLPSGVVLAAGGISSNGYLTSAEIFNPATSMWSAAGSLATARFGHTGTLLPGSKVLAVGGLGNGSISLASAELYTAPDSVPPVVAVPANVVVEATGPTGAFVNSEATATDNVGVTSLVSVPSGAGTFALGTTTVNVTAMDAAGNVGTGSYTVTVVDTTAPRVVGDFPQVTLTAGTPLPDYTGLPVTSDVVGVTGVSQTPLAGSPTSVGTILLTLSVYDNAGNTSYVSFSVTVTPADPPLTVLSSKGGAVPLAGVSGSGVQAGALWATFGVPSVNVAGQVAFLGSWKAPAVTGASPLPAQSGTGIFLNGVLVVKKGDAAPGIANAVISALKEPLLGPDGSVAFVATLANAPTTTGAVLSTDNSAIFLDADGAGPNAAVLIARKGGIATGATVWSAFTSVSLGANAVAFTATLVNKTAGVSPGPGGATTLSDTGLWRFDRGSSTMALALREGDGLLGSTVKTISALVARPGSAGQGRGVEAYFGVDYTPVRVTLADGRQVAAYTGPNGGVVTPYIAGDAAVDYGVGALWQSFGIPTQSANTEQAFLGTVKAGTGTATSLNNVAIFAEDHTSFFTLARVVAKGDAAAGVSGGVFTALKDPVSAGGRSVAFVATMKSIPGITALDNDGVWSFSDVSGLDLVAREGYPAAEAGGGVWKTFTSLALPEGRGPLFVASMHSTTAGVSPGPGGITTATDVGLWATDSTGALRLLLQEGDVIGASTVKTFTVLSSVTGSPAQTRSFNHGGSVLVRATDTLGAQHLLQIAVP